jgi:hypothetical protein
MASSDLKVTWKNSSFYNLRRDPAVIRELERRGRAITNAANNTLGENSVGNRLRQGRVRKAGYKMSSFQGRKVRQGRWFVQVYTSSNHAKFSCAKNNTLVKVLNATQRPSPSASALQEYTP